MTRFFTAVVQMILALVVCCFWSTSNAMPSSHSKQISNDLSPTGNEGFFSGEDWVQIAQAPPRIVQRMRGTYLELECEAVGTPSPTIQWLRGDSPITDNESYESNLIGDSVSVGLSKIKARLVVNNVLPIHQGLITCLATSGTKTATATTTLVVAARNFTDFLSVPVANSPPKVRIVLFNTVVMEPMGTDLIVPCKAIGGPKPDIFWIDANDQLITGQDPRIKVLPDGELRIRNLAWRDMGAYTCVARNAFSKDSISTFIYPLLNEN